MHAARFSLLVLLLSFSTHWAVGQDDFLFTVLGSKGNNTIDGQRVMIGGKIKKGQKITVAKDGYLGLAHKSGAVWETVSSGVYAVDVLAADIVGRKKTVKNRYYSMVASELLGEDGDRSRFGSVKTGSVTRGLGLQVYIALPKVTRVIPRSKISIYWYSLDSASLIDSVKLVLTTPDGKIVLSQVTSDTIADVALPKMFGVETDTLFLQIFDLEKGKKISPEHTIVDAGQLTKLKLMAFVKDFDDHHTPMDYLGFAHFLNSMELYANTVSVHRRSVEEHDLDMLRERMSVYLIYLKSMQGAFGGR